MIYAIKKIINYRNHKYDILNNSLMKNELNYLFYILKHKFTN